jgi:hypothetical protein
MSPKSRVTRVGEFSPLGQLFAMGNILKLTKRAKNRAVFFKENGYVILILTKCVAQHFGRFFTSSGHPVQKQ